GLADRGHRRLVLRQHSGRNAYGPFGPYRWGRGVCGGRALTLSVRGVGHATLLSSLQPVSQREYERSGPEPQAPRRARRAAQPAYRGFAVGIFLSRGG